MARQAHIVVLVELDDDGKIAVARTDPEALAFTNPNDYAVVYDPELEDLDEDGWVMDPEYAWAAYTAIDRLLEMET